MAARNTPVRDELVLSLDDILPVLKNGDGIPVVKHNNRGQSDQRRLRLDTDDSTLEVFRQSTNAYYFNRKTRTYNLRNLEEVGPATSVPGGQGGRAASPGRTLVFVFSNRNLYVTVETREVCAALVALFRPAGSALPNGSGGGQQQQQGGAVTAARVGGEDRDPASSASAAAAAGLAARNRYHLSPGGDGPSMWGGGRAGAGAGAGARPRRASENAASARRALEHHSRSARSVSGTGDARNANGHPGNMRRSRGGVRGEAGGPNGMRGRTGRRNEGMLMRSVSDTLGAELLDVDGASTSSSDEERDGPAALARTPAGSSFDGSQQRSPKSTSESPDAIMRSRMVGFGSTDVRKSKRAGKGSSMIPTWARFSDPSERRGPSPAAAAAAAPASTSATQPASRLKNTGLAIEGKADVEEDAGEGVSAEGLRHKSSSSDPSTTKTTNTTTLYGGGHGSPSGPLAVRKEDRLTAESLRRPPSAPGGVLATDSKESPPAFQDPAPAQPSRASSKSRPVNSSPPERHGRASPPLGRGRVNPPQLLPPTGTGTGTGGGSGGALQNEAFAFSRRPELSPTVARSSNTTAPATPAAVLSPPPPPELAPAPKPKGAVPALEPRIVDKRKIPPLARPVAADPPLSQRQQQQQQQQGPPTVKATPPPPDAAAVAQKRFEAIYRDSSYDSSESPPLSASGREVSAVPRRAEAVPRNGGARGAGAGALERKGVPAKQRFSRSSSVDSLEVDESYHPRHTDRPMYVRSSTSFSEEDVVAGVGGRRSSAGAPAHPGPSASRGVQEGRSAVSKAGRGAQERETVAGRRHRQAEEDAAIGVATLVSRRSPETVAAASHTSRSLPFLDERHPSVVEDMGGGTGGTAGERAAGGMMTVDRLESFGTSRTDSFGPPNSDKSVGKLTIQPALSPDVYAAPSEAGTTMTCDSGSLPFAPTPAAVAAATAARAAFNGSRGSRGSMVSYGSRGSGTSYGRRGSGGTDCTSPGSPPGGAVGEARASIYLPTAGVRAIPAMSGLHLSGGAPRDEAAQGPSGFEELWAVLEPTWDINSSFGASCAPKAMLLGGVYEKLCSFQAAVSSVCVRACGPVLGEVCRRCARAWAVLISRSVQDIVECTDLVRKIESSVLQLIDVVERYRASAVVRRFTLPLIGKATAWEEILAGGEGGDLQEPCARIEKAIAQLSEKEGEGGKRSGSSAGAGAGAGGSAGGGGGSGRPGRRGSFSMDLKLPPCPSYWAKGQFDQLTPNRLADVLTLLHEPARFAELAELVTHASDVGPASRDYSAAWNCVRKAEGPALGRELRRALSATLVAAGELLPLPRVPPPPPAYVPREKLTEQIEATILHPFLPLGIAGIGGPSGSGKTVLAAAVVRDATVRCRFGDRVFWLHAGKGANHRLVSVLQGLADTVYAWLTDGEHAGGASSPALPRRSVGSGGGGSDAGGGGGGDPGAALADPNLREPVRFRDQDQAVNYVADLCRGPLLAGLRCLVVVDDVHEREVVDALWKSGCQLLVTSPVKGLLQAVGAEATVAQPLGVEVARQLATRAAGEVALCEEGSRLVDLCRGCPLALAMSGAITQAVFNGGSDAREYRKPGLATPRSAIGEDTAAGGGDGGSGKEEEPSTWSFSTLAAPVGAWVEQVVVGTSGSPPTNRQRQGGDAPSSRDKGRPAATGPGEDVRGVVAGAGGEGAVTGAAAAAAATVPGHELGPEATAWANLARRVDAALARLGQSRSALCGLLAEAGPEQEMPVRQLVAVLTELALQEADRILGGSGWAVECYLSFALLPEGHPLPPPALEEFWRSGRGAEEGAAAAAAGRGGSSFAAAHNLPSPVEVFEALRMVCRAGGGEGADGLVLHGLQRAVVSCLALRHPEAMQKAARRRARTLSRISSLVGTFDDACWGLRGADAGAGGASGGDDSSGGDGVAEAIPSGLMGSGRPGPPHHGYGGFSRYDYLVASWDALPAPYSLTSAVAGYVSSVRAAYREAAAAAAAAALVSSGGNQGEDAAEGAAAAAAAGGAGGWAAARALASAADMLALAGQRSRAIAVYEEACGLLAEEAARATGAVGVPQKERAARESHHKVASMLQELAMLAAQFEREAPAIRLLQRAVEMHLSALEASGVLVPHFAGGNEHRSKLQADGGDATVAAAAAAADVQGRGADVTYRAVVDDARPLCSRLWLQFPVGTRERAASAGRGDGGGGGGGNGNLPAFGRLDVVGTCVGDLGLVLACTRVLRQEEKVDESAQLAEKVYPVLKEILGADHAFTKAALAAFVGQGIVDQCWKETDVHGSGSSGGHPSLPSPTSRRRLARSSGGRGASAAAAAAAAASGSAGASASAAQSTAGSPSLAATTLSDLSLPPSPLPEEFYARYSSSVNGANSGRGDAPAVGHGGSGGGGGGGRGRSNSGFSNSGSVTSGTEGDDGEDSDSGGSGPLGVHRRAGPVGGGAYGSLSFPRRVLNGGRQEHGWRMEGAHGWGQGEAAAAAASSSGGGAERGGGGVEPASSRMQQEIYFRHRTRRARAHAFLITAATRARLKNADRDEAGLFLRDLGRQAGATSSGSNGGGGREGVAGLAASPDGTPQMARLTRRS